ncbi:MAG TPA: c-type cytochrome [Burkholderiales bacterium]|nr:c-type cytochrome [Burkholderiales bacterium]
MQQTTSVILGIALAVAAGAAHAQADAKRGEKVFEECRACHAPDGAANEVGPGLRGVFGRKAGEREDFRYSPALKRSNITWTPQTIDTFIADPQKVVPANRMPYAGLPDARARADLIQYMQQAFK